MSGDYPYPPPTPEQAARYWALRDSGATAVEATRILRAETRAGRFPGRGPRDVPPER
ncbi:hypothetical protein ACWEPC_01945 [Nonomuraea sp. NPDC004297]